MEIVTDCGCQIPVSTNVQAEPMMHIMLGNTSSYDNESGIQYDNYKITVEEPTFASVVNFESEADCDRGQVLENQSQVEPVERELECNYDDECSVQQKNNKLTATGGNLLPSFKESQNLGEDSSSVQDISIAPIYNNESGAQTFEATSEEQIIIVPYKESQALEDEADVVWKQKQVEESKDECIQKEFEAEEQGRTTSSKKIKAGVEAKCIEQLYESGTVCVEQLEAGVIRKRLPQLYKPEAEQQAQLKCVTQRLTILKNEAEKVQDTSKTVTHSNVTVIQQRNYDLTSAGQVSIVSYKGSQNLGRKPNYARRRKQGNEARAKCTQRGLRAEEQRRRRLNEGEAARTKRRKADAERKRIYRLCESEAARAERLRADVIRKRLQRLYESEAEREARRKVDVERKRISRKNESEAERASRLRVDAERKRLRRQFESEAARAERLKADVKRKRLQRLCESEAERETRLKADVERKRIGRKSNSEAEQARSNIYNESLNLISHEQND